MYSEENGNDFNIEDHELSKRRKLKNFTKAREEIVIDSPKSQLKCGICKQYNSQITLYEGHPNNSVEEFIALTDEKLSLFTGAELDFNDQDDFPTHQITNFSVYDNKGHLCPFNTGLIEKNVELRFSGYIKPVYEEDPSSDSGVPAYDLGPINEWWTAGYDGGDKLPIGFSTSYAEYYLMEPSLEYEPIFQKIRQKVYLTKIVIDFLLDNIIDNPSYEDLLHHVESTGEYTDVEDALIQNAQFLCDQVVNYDKGNTEEDEKLLISLPCMRSLVNLAGVTFKQGKKIRRLENQAVLKQRPKFTKAVTTPLVHDVFENFFPDQIDKKLIQDENKGPKKRRCGVCEACQSPDCGECTHCKDMLKFGGSGRAKQACKLRRCPNMAILDAELSDNEEETDTKELDNSKITNGKRKKVSRQILHKCEWEIKSERKYKIYDCYDTVTVGEMTIQPGDFVTLKSENPNEPLCIAKVIYMYDAFPQKFLFHGVLFFRGIDTVIGETADPRELFLVDNCDDLPLGSVIRKASVEFRTIPENWDIIGGETHLPQILEDDGEHFYYSKRYESDPCRFIDIQASELDNKTCISCIRKAAKNNYSTPIFNEVDNTVTWQNEVYKENTAVFLNPDVYAFENDGLSESASSKSSDIDDKMYPEYYRKKSDFIKGSNADTPKPFIIGIIDKVSQEKKSISITVRILFRPENTYNIFSSYMKDLNYVYWSEEFTITTFDKVCGKCHVAFSENLVNPSEWSKLGPYRFYFSECFDPTTRKINEVPSNAKRVGFVGKGKGGKGKSKAKLILNTADYPPEWGRIRRDPLRMMDVFAGCGGLSEGLHQVGVAETKWAIEKELPAAQAFRINNPDCKVFSDDCNQLLKVILSGQGKEKGLPCKGEVEMLVGGPPCQGFSGMNRFSAGQYSLFKNSLVASYLSFCEYYRPKYFVLENVRNFVYIKKNTVLKLTVRCLLAMGYQVSFGVLQAGNYGVPQTRRRLIIFAAAPGCVLPRYPEPQHCFNRKGNQLVFTVGDGRFSNGCQWTDSAPYRTICVRDAMCDLPEIPNGWNKPEMPYDVEATSHFQRMMRGNDETELVKDHICKEMAPLVEARIMHIPTAPGSDWRDLPNISVKLKDDTTTQLLQYNYHTKKQSKSEPPKGVCKCATGKSCSILDRQNNTIIPWCLPHTADRHNNWSGLYGRLEWDGFFGTTITNPEPMGKQGRVLHPEQNRVVSVRECARSQGFPDKFKFFGNILDRHRQVGNAVPPPLAAALGREIMKAIVETEQSNNNNKLEKIEDIKTEVEA